MRDAMRRARARTAMRLPSVIVPVLSRSSTSTSPAASTARPLIAMTFLRSRRSMPAMPMAESRPPIVVGMRHTSNATIDGRRRGGCRSRARAARASRTPNRKMIVRPTRRMCSAISFGVFLSGQRPRRARSSGRGTTLARVGGDTDDDAGPTAPWCRPSPTIDRHPTRGSPARTRP